MRNCLNAFRILAFSIPECAHFEAGAAAPRAQPLRGAEYRGLPAAPGVQPDGDGPSSPAAFPGMPL